MDPLVYQGLIYSLDDSLTKKKLRDGEYEKNRPTDGLSRRMKQHNVGCIVDGMADFHFAFQFILSKPYILYYMGDLSLLDKQMLAIVGPRRKSAYADTVLHDLFAKLKGSDLVTISGMAPGVDSLCHTLSIQNNIPTIAVLGGGLAHFYKKQKKQIEAIVQSGGLVLSEFPLGMKPAPYTFPQRNRIIAGLAHWVFLPEATQGSGSLITVDFAQKMHKPIYATPNSIYAQSSIGINEKIAQGDVKAVWDIGLFVSETLGIKKNLDQRDMTSLSATQQSIVTSLHDSSYSTQQLAHRLQLSVASVAADLSLLEIDGWVSEGEGKKYFLSI